MKCRIALLALLAACTTSSQQTSPQRSTAYPPGRWRLAPEQQLAQTVVYASHILIRHSEVQHDMVCFSLADFHSTGPAPTRTREQALALAEHVASRARAAPDTFAALAREYSEDIVRRDQGGSLGYTTAVQLRPWSEVLDALAALQPGQVSTVVETTCGLHILYKGPPPREELVSGVRLVIGHEKAGWLGVVAQPSGRSREAAWELAWQLHTQVSQHPERLPDLIQQKSEGPDVVTGGDLGTWSTREPAAFPSEIEVLSKLPVGGVAPPMDSLFGIEILMRTPNRARHRLALEGTHLYFNPEAASGSPESAERVLELAKAKTAELQQRPGALEQGALNVPLLREHWLEGRGDAALTVALQGVEIGEILPEPVRSSNSYVIGQRIAPPVLAPAEILLDLPSPPEPDVPSLMARLPPEAGRQQLQSVTEELERQGTFDGASLGALQALVSRYSVASEGVAQTYQSFDSEVQHSLGNGYEQYRRTLNRHFEAQLLAPRKPRSEFHVPLPFAH